MQQPATVTQTLKITSEDMKARNQEPRTYTEKRNWNATLQNWKDADNGPSICESAIVDMHASEGFGAHAMVEQCPTITKSRAEQNGYWVVFRAGNEKYYKRQLEDEEYCKLQGWPLGEAKKC